MSDRLRISRTWAERFAEQKLAVPMLLRRAGLSPGLFQQEKVYVTTAELFALWKAVGEMSSDPALGLKLGAETRFERSHPAAIAVMCSRTFADALERLGRYKKLTCPEEIRVHKKAEEAAVEFFYVEAAEPQPDVLVDMVLSWILSVGQRGTDGQVAPIRLELIRPPKTRLAVVIIAPHLSPRNWRNEAWTRVNSWLPIISRGKTSVVIANSHTSPVRNTRLGCLRRLHSGFPIRLH